MPAPALFLAVVPRENLANVSRLYGTFSLLLLLPAQHTGAHPRRVNAERFSCRVNLAQPPFHLSVFPFLYQQPPPPPVFTVPGFSTLSGESVVVCRDPRERASERARTRGKREEAYTRHRPFDSSLWWAGETVIDVRQAQLPPLFAFPSSSTDTPDPYPQPAPQSRDRSPQTVD